MTNYEIGLTIIVIALAILEVSNSRMISKLCELVDILTEGFHDMAQLAGTAADEAKSAREMAVQMHDADRNVLESLKVVLEDIKKVHYGNQG